jgi:hypothetical protein
MTNISELRIGPGDRVTVLGRQVSQITEGQWRCAMLYLVVNDDPHALFVKTAFDKPDDEYFFYLAVKRLDSSPSNAESLASIPYTHQVTIVEADRSLLPEEMRNDPTPTAICIKGDRLELSVRPSLSTYFSFEVEKVSLAK